MKNMLNRGLAGLKKVTLTAALSAGTAVAVDGMFTATREIAGKVRPVEVISRRKIIVNNNDVIKGRRNVAEFLEKRAKTNALLDKLQLGTTAAAGAATAVLTHSITNELSGWCCDELRDFSDIPEA